MEIIAAVTNSSANGVKREKPHSKCKKMQKATTYNSKLNVGYIRNQIYLEHAPPYMVFAGNRYLAACNRILQHLATAQGKLRVYGFER